MSENAFRHVEHFASVIGPRGSATLQEQQAHAYCQTTLEELGYAAHRDEFSAPVSGWHPYALALALMLVADALFVGLGRGPNAQAGALAAAALGLIVTISFWLQLQHRSNPLLWLVPAGVSQNVWAVAEPQGEARRHVVVLGHVDTQRAALGMQSPALWQAFRAVTLAASVALVALVALFIWGIFTPDPLPRTLALYLGALPVLGLIFTLQPSFAPYVRGANDNATGAGAVLALAERLKAEPLAATRVYLVNTGCGEVGGNGAENWIERHAASEAPGASYLVLESLGGKGTSVNYVVDETVVVPVKADPGLVAHAEAAAREHPELGAQPFHYRGLFSEMSVCAVKGQKALALINFDPKTGTPPNFYTARDDLGNVDPQVLDRSEQFVWALLQKLDAAG